MTEEQVKWSPDTEENKFTNEAWQQLNQPIQDEYTLSFEELDLFIRNIFRSLVKQVH